MTVATTDQLARIDAAIDAGVRRLLELQNPGGWWVGELESNVTMTAQHLFWHHFLGLRTPELDRRIANELMARMRDDGTWSIWWEGPADLSTTVEAYVALRMCGVDPGDKTRDYINGAGGIPKVRVFTKCFLALFDQWPWGRIPPVPVEMVLLPPSAPFSIYNLACWARQTVVPLAGVMAMRPIRKIDVDLTHIGARPGQSKPAKPHGPIRRRALDAAEKWIRERQEADGGWGGIQPPWAWGLIFLACRGRGFEDPQFTKAFEGWVGFMVEEGEGADARIRPEACQSPVWDTGLALLGLRACGVPADHPQLRQAADWLIGEEVRVKGDWAMRRPDLAPGGWAFEFQNDFYPDVDDTAVIALALKEMRMGDAAVRRGLEWIVGMQCANGGWGAFDADNTSEWLYKIPFFDFGAVIDPPSVDVSAHALEVLAPLPEYQAAVERGLQYVLAEQEEDGSWFGRWGVNHIYGTGAALPALEACGVPHDHPAMRRGVAWLDSVQHGSGGFGEDVLSYADRAWRGRGTPTPSQTAWALLGYVAAGEERSDAARRAVDYLIGTQRPDGDWDEAHFTGTGFPLDFMIRYHLYRLHFPLLALGRLRERLAR